MYLQAESVKVDTDEGRLTLEIKVEDWEGAFSIPANSNSLTLNIHGIDLDAFYASVQSGVGGYLRERDEALRTFPRAFYCDSDESAGYDLNDPKHPDFHSVHADIWDNREGK